jgi:F-type H+-transporting ATPase subunit b
MGTLFQQLGGLVLGSVPTMLLFLVTLAAYRLLVHTPLKKVLAERYARTQGAIEKAAAAIAAAEAKTAEYEERVRAARAGIFRDRHERLHKIHVESELALSEARSASQERVATAVIAIEESATAARLQMDSLLGELTSEVLRAVVPSGAVVPQEQAG